MSNDIVQASYDELATIAARFAEQAQATIELQSRIQRCLQALEDGGWIGEGSQAFFAEMNGEVNPAIQRMIAALEAASAITSEISQIIRQAEEEAAALLRGQATPAAPTASTPAAQGDSGGNGFLKGVHEVLDWAGFVPGLGAVPDLINAGIYAVEGDLGNAALSGVAAIPIVGDAIKGVDKARDVVKAVDKLSDTARAADKVDDAADGARAVDKVDDATDATRAANKAVENIDQGMQDKILYGQRKSNPNSPGGMSNEVIGGHSPKIKDDPNFAVEELSKNSDGTTNVKYTTQFPDGNLAKIKKSTLAPDNWSDQKIIDTTVDVANTPAVATRARDGATMHRQNVDGVEWEVIRDSAGNVTSSYPTGGVPTNNF